MSKSKFMTAAEEMKDKLGPALCLAKWQQVSLHLPTGLNNSCYHPPLHEMDAQVVEIHPSAIHNTRYFKYMDILMESRGFFNRVFLTDVRDVAFQGDIFAEIDQPGLHCFMEDPDWTCDERFNKYILTSNYGEEVAAEFADKRIICSGTTLGDADDVLNYIVALMNERDLEKMMKVGGIPDEQAPHNFIFHRDKLPHTKQENGDGVATICLTHPNQIKILDDGRVSIYGKTPAIVHQWDRHPNLVDHYNKIYSGA